MYYYLNTTQCIPALFEPCLHDEGFNVDVAFSFRREAAEVTGGKTIHEVFPV